jgi:hypothetical protein
MVFYFTTSRTCRHCGLASAVLISLDNPGPIFGGMLEAECSNCGMTDRFPPGYLVQCHNPEAAGPEARWIDPPGQPGQ